MNKTKLRVLLISPLPPPAGGIASWTEQILCYAAYKNDLQLEVINTSVIWRSVTEKSVWKRVICGIIQAIYNAGRLCFLLLKLKPNLVHICTSGSLSVFKDIIFLILCRIRRVPTIIHFRTGQLPIWANSGGLLWLLTTIVVNCAGATIVLDRASEETLRIRFPIKQILKLPNFIDLSGHLYRSVENTCGNINITFVGHVVPAKGVLEIVHACSRLYEYKLIVNLVGPFEEYFAKLLQKIASDSGVDLRLHGQVNRIKALLALQDADIVVLPSYTEGFPNVILEAMSAEKPIIATRVGAIPEMLAEGSEFPCGLFINPCSIDELENALRHLIENRELAKFLARNAYNRVVDQYRTEVVVEKLIEIWQFMSK